jgi:hypothetical protein
MNSVVLAQVRIVKLTFYPLWPFLIAPGPTDHESDAEIRACIDSVRWRQTIIGTIYRNDQINRC